MKLSQKQLQKAYQYGYYILTRSKIYQVFYSNAQKCFYAREIYKQPYKNMKPFTEHGNATEFRTADEVNWMLGVNLIRPY